MSVTDIDLQAEIFRLRRENASLRAQLAARRPVPVQPDAEEVVAIAGFVLPRALRHVAERLHRSRAMLSLGDDWDGEGSPGYREETWRRVAELVVDATTACQREGRDVPAPIITKGSEGSIDLQWRTPTRNVLIKVPAEATAPITFYAHDQERQERDLGGKLDPSASNEWLLVWLTV